MVNVKILLILGALGILLILNSYTSAVSMSVHGESKTQLNFKSSKISYADLEKLKMLEDDELIGYEWYGKKAEGIKVDLNGDGEDEIIIAGVARTYKHAEESDVDNLAGYIKIIKLTQNGKYRLLSKRTFDSSRNILDDIQVHNIDRSGIPKVLVTFTNMGSTYYWTDNVIVYYRNRKFQYFTKDAPGGPLEIKDLNGDGVEEIIDHPYYDSGAPAPDRIFWYNIYEWTGNGLRKINEKYPQFYEEKISSYYEKNIEQAVLELNDNYERQKYYIEANRTLITRAKEIINRTRQIK